jgi:hypothetical protein
MTVLVQAEPVGGESCLTDASAMPRIVQRLFQGGLRGTSNHFGRAATETYIEIDISAS